MKKVLFMLLVIGYWLFGYSVTHAAGPGINIGTKYTDIDPAISAVGSGGWIVVIFGGTGDCAKLQEVVAKTDSAGVNLIIRGHLNNRLSPQDAIAWTATLGNLKHTKKVYFMPWNEPNQDGSGDAGTPTEVKAYTSALIDSMKASGVWDGKIRLLSPMLNRTHPNYETYLNSLGGAGYYDSFYGVASNLYDADNGQGNCSPAGYQPFCTSDPHSNAKTATSLFGNRKVFGVEAGPGPGEVFYFNQDASSGSFIHQFVSGISSSPAVMFAVPSYDLGNEKGHNWKLFNPADTVNLLKNMPKNSTEGVSFNQSQFDGWLNTLKNNGSLISCGNCGFTSSANPNLCNGTGGISNFTLPAECNLNEPGDKTSRPAQCNLCNQTNKMTPECATDFKVFDKVSYERHEGDQCNGEYWVEKQWGGNVTLDLGSTNIPYVGNNGEENDRYYLADYYEGIYPYYTNTQVAYNLLSPSDQRQAFMQGGVWAKLSTVEMQDSLKIKMIKRAIASKNGTIAEDVIRDYNVIYNGVTKKLTDFNNNFPPADTVARADWEKNNDFGKMWFMVPMFTREDTKGSVVPYLGSMQKDQFKIQDFDKSTVEKVPHVARLYEVSHAINQLLLPAANQTLTVNNTNKNNLVIDTDQLNNNPKLLASADTLPSNNTTLLAQGGYNCGSPYGVAIENVSFSGSQLDYGVRFTLTAGDGCQGHLRVNGRFLGIPICPPDGYLESNDPNTGLPSVPASDNGTFTITVSTSMDQHKPCGWVDVSQSCTVTIVNGNITNSSCGSAPPPGPVCGSFTARSVSACQKPADSGPGDTICCGPIVAELKAVDRIVNTDHQDCSPIDYPLGGDPCHDTKDADVQRSLGVALSHPYLETIWQDTADINTGFINLWKLADAPAFEPKEAKSSINYSYSSTKRNPNIAPSSGDFYYPYLKGIFDAKNWLVTTLLTKEEQER